MKMKKKILILTLNITLIFLFHIRLDAYSLKVHERITEEVIKQTEVKLNQYLKNIGLSKGVNEELKSGNDKKEVIEWIKYGSWKEDLNWDWNNNPLFSHFYNPVTNTSGVGLWPSAYDWANASNNDWSWKKVREFFYQGLTLTTKTQREEALAKAFRGIGHIIHLVEDVSVPAHTRADLHVPVLDNEPYESYTNKNISQLQYTSVPFPYWNISNSPAAPRQFWDVDSYDGSTPYSGEYVGLAEYTNENFFSNDTIFKDFSYPDWPSIVEYNDVNINGKERIYLKKLGYAEGGYSESINHLAAGKWFYKYIPSSLISLKKSSLKLDEKCHEDYQQKLIPRAVGYSAGLLDYFFRGDIDLEDDTVIGSGYVIVNNTEEDMDGTFEIHYDDVNDIRKLLWSATFTLGTLSSGANKSSNITFTPPTDAKEEGRYILVFKGRLGNEDNAVVGKVINNALYFIVIPVNSTTREMLGKQYYSRNLNVLNPITETDLPFEIVDDGGYWNPATSTWTATSYPDSLGAPLSVGGPQYIAKYWDEANQRVRFVPNLSYEKEAYHAFNRIYKNLSNEVIKDFYNVTFNGSRLNFGAYEENPGYMEYTEDTNNPGTFGLYSLRPKLATTPSEIFFPMYRSLNFNDAFLEYDTSKFYYFNGAVDVQTIPKDIDAPYSSIVAVSKTGNVFNIEIPKIFNYTRPNTYWPGSAGYGSSGIDNYTASIATPMNYSSYENKCMAEDNNCGNIYKVEEGSSNTTSFNIPYNFNSWVHVVADNANNQYYEELYINGQPVETSSISTDKLQTHYQILAVYKDIAVIRETNYISYNETPLNYSYINFYRIYDRQWNFTARYYIYVKGVRNDLTGTTSIISRNLDIPYQEIPEAGTTSAVHYLTYEVAEDITGYHIDRIFISDSFDSSSILVAFDEYAYNSGAGLVHDLKYELSDEPLDQGEPEKYILYYSIPLNEIQAVDHAGARVGRKLLLFNADGTLNQSLQDPVGLNFTIGSIGILN